MNWADFILYAFIGLLCLLVVIALSIVGLIISVSRQIGRTGESARQTKKAIEKTSQMMRIPLLLIQLVRSKRKSDTMRKGRQS